MRRVLPFLVLIAAPILGVVVATVIAWLDEVPGSHGLKNVSIRLEYAQWGLIWGAALGVIGAIGLHAAGKKKVN